MVQKETRGSVSAGRGSASRRSRRRAISGRRKPRRVPKPSIPKPGRCVAGWRDASETGNALRRSRAELGREVLLVVHGRCAWGVPRHARAEHCRSIRRLRCVFETEACDARVWFGVAKSKRRVWRPVNLVGFERRAYHSETRLGPFLESRASRARSSGCDGREATRFRSARRGSTAASPRIASNDTRTRA